MNLGVGDTHLFCERIGRGTPILTMHGPGFDHTLLHPWLDPLGEFAEVIYYDHRGCGRSSRADADRVTAHMWVSDAEALQSALGYDKVVVLGHSMGGFLAQLYALRYPERVAALVLCNTAAAFDYPDVMMANARRRSTDDQFAAICQAFSAPLATDEALRDAWLTIAPVYFGIANADALEWMRSGMRFSASASNVAMFKWVPTFNTTPQLHRIQLPTLVVTGRQDWVTPLEPAAQRLAVGIPGASLAVFEQSGHFPFIEEADLFVDTVWRWLCAVGRAGAHDDR